MHIMPNSELSETTTRTQEAMVRVAVGLVAMSVAASAFAAWTLAPNSRLAIHFGFGGADGFASKNVGLGIYPGLGIVFLVLVAWGRRKARRSGKDGLADEVGLVSVLALLLALQGVAIAVAEQGESVAQHLPRFAVATMLVIGGVVMRFVGPNSTLGIRTPWTLRDPVIWRSTHRLFSWPVVAVGATGFFLQISAPELFPPVLLFGAVLVGVASVVYSYVLSKSTTRAA